MAVAANAMAAATRPHALVIPYPTSGFINPALHLARLLHSAGVIVTFVNTEHNHAILRARGLDHGVPDGFRYEAIPDGLAPSERGVQDYGWGLLRSVREHSGEPLRELILRLNLNAPPVTCVVASELMSFALDVAAGLGLPAFMLWGNSACGLACGLSVRELRRRGHVPLKGHQA
ncbi:hypothetical protein PR202_gb17466 [Eleusine coracana subsp. coracana]|uniref:Uncharacterized protein n=1 Tax=Eleusine coracana subsp. coracana TaxID=191504 RepID=A0AAV5F0P6_ELECO|nr:hypothetical protein PR202_gb17466 [Eleusine coracana subsp. coracana]